MQPYDDFDVAVIKALQGPMRVAERPYDEAAAEVGVSTDKFIAHLDIDAAEIGKVKAVQWSHVADAKQGLSDLLKAGEAMVPRLLFV